MFIRLMAPTMGEILAVAVDREAAKLVGGRAGYYTDARGTVAVNFASDHGAFNLPSIEGGSRFDQR